MCFASFGIDFEGSEFFVQFVAQKHDARVARPSFIGAQVDFTFDAPVCVAG
jgi:hypothetical protein